MVFFKKLYLKTIIFVCYETYGYLGKVPNSGDFFGYSHFAGFRIGQPENWDTGKNYGTEKFKNGTPTSAIYHESIDINTFSVILVIESNGVVFIIPILLSIYPRSPKVQVLIYAFSF